MFAGILSFIEWIVLGVISALEISKGTPEDITIGVCVLLVAMKSLSLVVQAAVEVVLDQMNIEEDDYDEDDDKRTKTR